jgi:hypothetical protein
VARPKRHNNPKPLEPEGTTTDMSAISITVNDQVYVAEATLDVDGDGHPDGVLVDFDGDGTADDIAWDSDGDGVIDTILVASQNDGNFDTGYYDPSGRGEWNESGHVPGGEILPVDHGGSSDGSDGSAISPALVDNGPSLAYAFGDSHTPTEVYHSEANVDMDGDGVGDAVAIDMDGSGGHDDIAWDSDGDGRVDMILVDSDHDGTIDTVYTDPNGNGHWDHADTIGS